MEANGVQPACTFILLEELNATTLPAVFSLKFREYVYNFSDFVFKTNGGSAHARNRL
jgi:hypothetical protein